ncbi:hypothetical protein CVT25_013599 [Psilocybe cyanescens]|uniref:Uncharacterized protein n=1 Tax=Psilocybe cyanescens TaxID=93625 RepID=A0A409WSX9_PSICY|nr:hypothetical protein CVT25_013599 [Psilocybe cyanescens]
MTRPLPLLLIKYYGWSSEDRPSTDDFIGEADVVRFMQVMQNGVTLNLEFYGHHGILKLSSELSVSEPAVRTGGDHWGT